MMLSIITADQRNNETGGTQVPPVTSLLQLSLRQGDL